uniref:Protein TsetseEP domain-containing protein n=1 Tax=Anopheles atroparvus TaxID=41427 RepID=A0A182JJI9_ANOAO
MQCAQRHRQQYISSMGSRKKISNRSSSIAENVSEMNRLVLAFGIVCLLQGLSAAPRPEYGLTVSIKNSDRISAVGDAVSGILDDISGITLATLTAAYDKYDSTLSAVSDLIIDIDNIAQPILSTYSDLVEDENGDVEAAFAPFLTAIDGAVGYITGADVMAYIATFTANGYPGIVDQLNDEGNRLLGGLNALKSAAITVKGKISAALLAAENDANVPTAILNANLKLADMYAFLTAANNLKAFLPLLTYILETVNEHLQEGDDYITGLQSMLNEGTGEATTDYQDELDEVIGEIEGTVTSGFENIYDAYFAIYSSFGMLDLSSATDFTALDTTVSSFVSAFDAAINIDNLDISLAAAFDTIGAGLASLISDLSTTEDAVDNELVQLLVDTLIGNLEYGEYCYNKYKDLVENLLTEGLDGGWECVDKEYQRLKHLEGTLILILELLAFDYEFMEDELSVCDSIAGDLDNLNDCVTQLNTFYTDLLSATSDKRDLLYDLAEGEAEASKNRLLICFELVFIDTTVTQVAAITSGLTECAENGPNGSD